MPQSCVPHINVLAQELAIEATEHDGVEDLLVMMLSYVGLQLTSSTFMITLAIVMT